MTDTVKKMNNFLNTVSETALITLRARVLESEKENPVIQDCVGVEFINRLRTSLPVETWNRIFKRKLPFVLTRHIALRARKYDLYTRTFLDQNPSGLVVSLGCGFDTRYWRISTKSWRYIEVDLPEVVEIKKYISSDNLPYLMIASSAEEDKWINEILAIQNRNVLLLAEGLFMYLPQHEVENIFTKLSESFSNSWIVFEVVNKKYTKGIWKKIVAAKMRHALGTDAGSSYDFGIYDARDIESYGNNIKVTEEWSYLEDDDIKPAFLKLFKNIKLVSRTQWTVKAKIC